jgi:hypothetical protein
MSKSKRGLYCKITWDGPQELAGLEDIIKDVAQTFRHVSTTPVQLACDSQERLRMKHMDMTLEYEKTKLAIQDTKLELARLREEHRLLKEQKRLSGPKQEKNDSPTRQRVNGNGAVN